MRERKNPLNRLFGLKTRLVASLPKPFVLYSPAQSSNKGLSHERLRGSTYFGSNPAAPNRSFLRFWRLLSSNYRSRSSGWSQTLGWKGFFRWRLNYLNPPSILWLGRNPCLRWGGPRIFRGWEFYFDWVLAASNWRGCFLTANLSRYLLTYSSK